MRLKPIFLLALALATLGGCSLGPTKKELAALENLRLGSTTRSGARELLGQPWRSADAEWHVDIYQLGQRQLGPGGFNPGHLVQHSDVVDITTVHLAFDQTDVLQKTNIHRWTGKGKVKGFLVNRVGPAFTSADAERIKPGTTQLRDLEEWFGPPVLLGPDERGTTRAEWYSAEHGYGGYVDIIEIQSLVVRLDAEGNVLGMRFHGKLKPPKK